MGAGSRPFADLVTGLHRRSRADGDRFVSVLSPQRNLFVTLCWSSRLRQYSLRPVANADSRLLERVLNVQKPGRRKMFKRALPMLALAVSLASTNMTAHGQSKGDQALLDTLVRKGVLSEKEAEDISAESAKEAVTTSAAKIQVGDWVQELKIGGDLRLRFQS